MDKNYCFAEVDGYYYLTKECAIDGFKAISTDGVIRLLDNQRLMRLVIGIALEHCEAENEMKELTEVSEKMDNFIQLMNEYLKEHESYVKN